VLGFTDPKQTALTFKITQFHFPLDFSCPLQTSDENNRQFSGLVCLGLKSAKLNYRQEYWLRLTNYFLCQLIESLGDSNPYEDLRERLRKRLDPFGSGAEPEDLSGKRPARDGANKEVSDLM